MKQREQGSTSPSTSEKTERFITLDELTPGDIISFGGVAKYYILLSKRKCRSGDDVKVDTFPLGEIEVSTFLWSKNALWKCEAKPSTPNSPRNILHLTFAGVLGDNEN